METKYPAAAVVPVLLVHGLRWGFPLAFWLPAAMVVGGVEGWLHAESGVWHPLVVWENRGVVAHGPLDGRALGVLAMRTGRRLEWDGQAGRITNHPELNRLVEISARPGWRV